MNNFTTFFKTATNHPPYDWQGRLANGDGYRADDPATHAGTECASRLIDIPTGLGKTAGVLLAWLWNNVGAISRSPSPSSQLIGETPQNQHHPTSPFQLQTSTSPWPRRLIYCLPMRTLVEQTAEETRKWINNLETAGFLSPTDKPRVVILMGGESPDDDAADWDLYPEDNAILIGTQDMLLSRALNRGYGMSRYRWPIHFALLNNDCLWVMDEVQLMGAGLWTSAQLDWMRQLRFKPQFPVKTWWMSATLGSSFLATSDRNHEQMPAPDPVFRLLPEEEENLSILKGRRPIEQITIAVASKKPGKKRTKTAKAEGPTKPYEALVSHIVENHIDGTLSLVVCNRVAHAQETFKALKAIQSERRQQGKQANIELLTSRFRPADRCEKLASILAFENARKAGHPHKGLILVSTQVVEAGFDVSATRLWTQLAPWPSLVQRLGRLNRDGKSNEQARAFIFDFPRPAKDKTAALPYNEADLKVAESIAKEVAKLCKANPEKPIREIFEEIKRSSVAKKVKEAFEPKPQPYPRALDIHGLFSTEPDLFGGFTDVSPWVRNADQNADLTVFWRDFEDTTKDANAGNGPGFRRDEGCPVAVYRLKDGLGKSNHAYHWNDSTDQWESIRPDDIRPGMTLLLAASAGGYNQDFGWTGNKSDKLTDLPPPGPFAPSSTHDPESEIGEWVTLAQHLDDTKKVAQEIADRLSLTQYFRDALIEAAALHDIGKSFPQWQEALPNPRPRQELWAKSRYLYELTFTSQRCATLDDLKRILQVKDDGLSGFHLRETKPRRTKDSQSCRFLCRKKLTNPERKAVEKAYEGSVKLIPFRPGLRHEVASALAMWHRFYRAKSAGFPALAIYLVAAHHGKARTVLSARASTDEPNVEGIPIPSRDEHGHCFAPLPWGEDWQMDFAAAEDGASGHFSDDGTAFTLEAPGWTGLVADLLGGWEKDAPKHTCGAVPDNEEAAFGPFALAYLEALLRAADGRASKDFAGGPEAAEMSCDQNHR